MKEITIDGHKGHLMTVRKFKTMSEFGSLIDSDGMGDLVKRGKIVTKTNTDGWPDWIYPSQRDTIPSNITHILWYNK